MTVRRRDRFLTDTWVVVTVWASCLWFLWIAYQRSNATAGIHKAIIMLGIGFTVVAVVFLAREWRE